MDKKTKEIYDKIKKRYQEKTGIDPDTNQKGFTLSLVCLLDKREREIVDLNMEIVMLLKEMINEKKIILTSPASLEQLKEKLA